MMFRFVFAIFVVWVFAPAAHAQAQLSIVIDRLRIAELVEIMRTEGYDYSETLNSEMLNGQGGSVWSAQINQIYNRERMIEVVRGTLSKLPDAQLRQVNQFYGSSLGQRVVELELAGRHAMSQNELKEIAQEAYLSDFENDPESLEYIHKINQIADMIERNVTAALTANYRFYSGLVDGGALSLSEDEMLAEAWKQENEIRHDTKDWLMGYLILSYSSLEDDEKHALIEFMGSSAGKALNAAIFEGFSKMYADISYTLGAAVALNMIGSDL